MRSLFTLSLSVLLSLLPLTLTFASSVYIVPPQSISTQLFVRIGQPLPLPSPPFTTVYTRQIQLLDSNSNQQDMSSLCFPTAATITYTPSFSHQLHLETTLPRNQSDIITSFDQIKADRKVLDTILFNNKIYLFLRDNTLIIYNTNTTLTTIPQKYSLPSLAQKRSIELGYFTTASSQLLLVTRFEVFHIGEEIRRMEGYENLTDFESVRELFGGYFAVCGMTSGAVVYKWESGKVTKEVALNKEFFRRDAVWVSDIGYDVGRKEMFVSDLKYGINIVSLQQLPSPSPNTPTIKATLLNKGYRKTNCNVLALSSTSLYASCDDLYKINYTADESIITMPNPMFRVRQLLISHNLLIAIGEDILIKYYNDKLTQQLPEFDNIERLLFYEGNRYFKASYYQIEVGEYNVVYPNIVCQMETEEELAYRQQAASSPENSLISSNHSNIIIPTVVRTLAECNRTYFKEQGILFPRNLEESNLCLYSSPVQLIFWKAEKEFDMDFVLVLLAVLCGVTAIVVGWVMWMKNKEILLRRTLEKYVGLRQAEGSAAVVLVDEVMTEEKEGGGQKETEMKETHSID